jgi:hypothetical protein
MSVYPWSERWTAPRRESMVRIAAINGNVFTLTKPLDFEHLSAMSPPLTTPTPTLAGDYTKDRKVDQANVGNTVGPDGGGVESIERFKPYVANATRNIVIRSENPAGVRGHTVTTGDEAVQSLQYTAFVGLGRTTAAKLNDSNGTVPGTNQVGRYVVHLHHVHSRVPSHQRGLYISDSPKWGIVTHGTHDTKTEWCVVDKCVGSGIVTEDGPEVRNTFERNFVMGSEGTVLTDYPEHLVNGKQGTLYGQPGSEGAGFWFHGLKNRINGNVSINNKIGINFVHFGALDYKYPSRPGGPMDTPYDKWTAKTLEMNGNVTAANLLAGTETWDAGVTATNLDAWHNGGAQILAEENGGFNLTNARCLAQGWITEAIRSNSNYNWHIKVHNSRLEGCAVGCQPVRLNYKITNSTLYNKINIDWRRSPYVAPQDYEVNCLGIPAAGDHNLLIDWDYDERKINLEGSPYEESQ